MADAFVGVAVDGAGKKIDTTELVVGANTVERQRVQLAGSAASDLVKTRSDGFLSVMMDPTTIMLDTHDFTPDTTNVWTQAGTSTPAYAIGSVTFNAGTVANATSYMYSKPTAGQGASGWLIFASVFTIDAAVVTGNKRFWGCGIFAGTPSMAAPLANAAVFEISDVDGLLYAVTYSNSVRTAQIAVTRPTDGGPHRYAVFHKTSKVLYEIDGVTVATIANPNLQQSVFSALAGSFNGATTLVTSATCTSSVMSLADSGRNNTRISDATYPWRQAKVSATGDQAVSLTTLPAGTNLLGKIGIDQTTPGTTNGVSITNTSLAVTGAFFQTTQPVSGAFFQTTQPVSLAINTPMLAAGSAIVGKFGIDQTTPGTTNAVSVTNASLAVTGTFFQATQPVSLAVNTPTISAGAAIIGKVGIDQTTPGTTNLVSTGASVKAASTPAVATDPALVVAISPNNVLSTKGFSSPSQTLSVAAATPVTGTGLDASTAGNVTFIIKNTVAGTPFTGSLVVFFEQSDDNVSWAPLGVTRSDTGTSISGAQTVTSLAANTSLMFDAALEGVNWVRSRVTTAPTANGVTIVTLPGSLPFTPSVSVMGTLPSGTNLIGTVTQQPASLAVSTLSVAATAVTATLPLVASQFHYITSIEIIRVNATITAVAAAASLLTITTTNLPGSLAWSIGNAIGAGAYDVPVRLTPNCPIKSSVAGTATTIVAPSGGTGVQFRINVYYYAGP